MSKLNESTLSPQQRLLLPPLSQLLVEQSFYLAGGTAVALLLGHRKSIDFECFTKNTIDKPLDFAEVVKSVLPSFEISSFEKGTLHGTAQGIKISFLEYHYQLMFEIANYAPYNLPLASLEDIGCMKLSAIVNRGSKKDFIDLFAICQEKIALKDLLRHYQIKYHLKDIGHVIFALAYFDDAESEPTPHLFNSLQWNNIKAEIKNWVKQL